MHRRTLLGAAAALCAPSLAHAQTLDAQTLDAQTFDARRFDGQSISLMFNNHPWSQAMRDMAAEFTARTGIKTRIEIFNEEQFRARLTTLMQGRSADVDAYMTLASREGALFKKAGWYADLAPLMADNSLTARDYDPADFSASIQGANTIAGQVIAVPINQEGPLLYWRRDVFDRAGIPEPKTLEDITTAAAALKSRAPDIGPWAARGLRAAIPYAFAGFVYNLGGSFALPGGKPGMAQPATIRAIDIYAKLLKDYGPPGALNHTFTQVIELLGSGRVAMAHESSNEFANILRFPGRATDLGIKVLPPGKETGISKPAAIGWGLAISTHSAKQQAAWQFLQWSTSKETQAKLIQAGVAPPRASVFKGPAFDAWASEQPIRRAWANALIELGQKGTGILQTPTERVPEAREKIGDAVQAVIMGKATAEEAAKAADIELAKLQ